MNKPVLCAVDIAEGHADKAVLAQAFSIAAAENRPLDVMSVLPDMRYGMVGSFFEDHHQDKAMEEARKHLGEMVEAHRPGDFDLPIRQIVAMGRVYEQVLKTAEHANSGLIVVGAHREGFGDFFIGPNAARVVRHAPCSVLVVKPE